MPCRSDQLTIWIHLDHVIRVRSTYWIIFCSSDNSRVESTWIMSGRSAQVKIRIKIKSDQLKNRIGLEYAMQVRLDHVKVRVCHQVRSTCESDQLNFEIILLAGSPEQYSQGCCLPVSLSFSHTLSFTLSSSLLPFLPPSLPPSLSLPFLKRTTFFYVISPVLFVVSSCHGAQVKFAIVYISINPQALNSEP